MIANVKSIYALRFLKNYFVILAKSETHELGQELASIDVHERGTGVTLYTSTLNERAQLLAAAQSERFARDWILVSTFTEQEFEQWHRLLLYNSANNISAPCETALYSIVAARTPTQNDREKDVS